MFISFLYQRLRGVAKPLMPLRLNFSAVLFSGFVLVSCFLLAKTSDLSTPGFLDWINSYKVLSQFDTDNELIQSLSSGFLVSSVFYLMVVYFPEEKRKRDARKFVIYRMDKVLSSHGQIFLAINHCSDLDVKMSSLTEDSLENLLVNVDLSKPSPIMQSIGVFEELYPHLNALDYELTGFKRGDKTYRKDLMAKMPAGYYLSNSFIQCSNLIEDVVHYSHLLDSRVLRELQEVFSWFGSWGTYLDYQHFYHFKHQKQLLSISAEHIWKLYKATLAFRGTYVRVYGAEPKHDVFKRG